jgi:hypothetical protein
VTRFHFKRPEFKPLADRNRFVVGLVGIAIIVAVVVAAFSYDKIPILKGTNDYSAFFAEAGGIKTDSDVRVSGMTVGRAATASSRTPSRSSARSRRTTCPMRSATSRRRSAASTPPSCRPRSRRWRRRSPTPRPN